MNILIADDNPISNKVLEEILKLQGHAVTITANGLEAWNALQTPVPSPIAILDWMMPEIDGLELCRRIRAEPRLRHLYLLMLSSLDRKEDIAEGLDAGANDYVTKPFNVVELKARINVAVRVAKLELELAGHVVELEKALAEVKQLKQFIPICAYCKKIRDDDNYWQQIEQYISSQLDTKFSHGICPDCYKKIFGPPPKKTHDQAPLAGKRRDATRL